MEPLKCSWDAYRTEYKICASCTNRACEDPQLDEDLKQYKEQHPEKTYQCCGICGHHTGLRMFDESAAHPDSKLFCELWQKYLKSRDGLCDGFCL